MTATTCASPVQVFEFTLMPAGRFLAYEVYKMVRDCKYDHQVIQTMCFSIHVAKNVLSGCCCTTTTA